MRFEGKSVIVTGAGHGIGRAVAERFASEGAKVGVNDIDPDAREGDRRRDRRRPRSRCPATSAPRRTSSASSPTAVDAHGPIDVLVNNAALATYEAVTRHFLEGDSAWWNRIIQTNLTSVFLCSNAVAMSMAKRRTGAIIHMSSGGASHAHRAMAAYDTAKGGIEALTRAMALDLAPYGVRVNFVVPGLIRTYDISDELAAERGQVVPLQRLGTADDMAGPIVFLASDDARYMTGTGRRGRRRRARPAALGAGRHLPGLPVPGRAGRVGGPRGRHARARGAARAARVRAAAPPAACCSRRSRARCAGPTCTCGRASSPGVPYPIIPGHVSVGRVAETDGALDVDGNPLARGPDRHVPRRLRHVRALLVLHRRPRHHPLPAPQGLRRHAVQRRRPARRVERVHPPQARRPRDPAARDAGLARVHGRRVRDADRAARRHARRDRVR